MVNIHSIQEARIHDRVADRFIRLHRIWWDGPGWRAEATDRKGNLIHAKPITEAYVVDILNRPGIMAAAEITYRSVGAGPVLPELRHTV
jgi:hypothetical protein